METRKFDAAKSLLGAGANVNASDEDMQTALRVAVTIYPEDTTPGPYYLCEERTDDAQDILVMIETLLYHPNININAVDKMGCAAAHLVVKRGCRIQHLELLVKAGNNLQIH